MGWMMDEVMVKPTGRRGTCPVCRTDVAELGPKDRPGVAVHYRKGWLCAGSYGHSERLLDLYDAGSLDACAGGVTT